MRQRTVPDSQRASNHNRVWVRGDRNLTVPDSQRASNHNICGVFPPVAILFPILKEHQITTDKEQTMPSYNCSRFSKSIKSQRSVCGGASLRYCSRFSKSIKSQLHCRSMVSPCNCSRFSKSIKSQLPQMAVFHREHCSRFSKSIKSQHHAVALIGRGHSPASQRPVQHWPLAGG